MSLNKNETTCPDTNLQTQKEQYPLPPPKKKKKKTRNPQKNTSSKITQVSLPHPPSKKKKKLQNNPSMSTALPPHTQKKNSPLQKIACLSSCCKSSTSKVQCCSCTWSSSSRVPSLVDSCWGFGLFGLWILCFFKTTKTATLNIWTIRRVRAGCVSRHFIVLFSLLVGCHVLSLLGNTSLTFVLLWGLEGAGNHTSVNLTILFRCSKMHGIVKNKSKKNPSVESVEFRPLNNVF